MNQTITAQMKKMLLDRKQSILELLASESDDLKDLLGRKSPKDLVDIAAEDIDKNIIDALGAQEIRQLHQIEAALSRIASGKYGSCALCGKSIPEDRLKAIPYALTCISCQSKKEKSSH